MSNSEYLESMGWVKGEKKKWPPSAKTILAFIVGFLLLSPAILGIYWEVFLAK